jgi:hypothetical protein
MTPLPAGHLSGRARDSKTHTNCELTLLAHCAEHLFMRHASMQKSAHWALLQIARQCA